MKITPDTRYPAAPLSLAFGATLLVAGQARPPESQPPPSQTSEVSLVISGDPGAPPRYAVPDFVASTADGAPPDPDTAAAAVRAVAPAFEVNARRLVGATDRPLGVADNLAQWGIVVGRDVP